MAFSALQALVVESSFSSRREIVSSLNQTGIVQSVVEAESIDDGLSQLSRGNTDTCLLGPTLSTTIAVNFVRNSGAILEQQGKWCKPCAFIAITGEDLRIPPELAEAGVFGLSLRPFEPSSFTRVVQDAVRVARERWEQLFAEMPGAGINQEHIQQLVIADLTEVLREVADRLRIVAQDITRGRLAVAADGKPSLATRDAMRLAIEAALPETSEASQIGSYDNLFVSALVDWFIDRSESTPQTATTALKRKLIAYADSKRATLIMPQ